MSAPGNPRDYFKLAFAAGNAAVFGGSPGEGVLYHNRLVYPLGDYTVGTDAPQIRIFDGITDRGVASIPKNVDGVICKAIVSMIAVNGTVYLTTFDAGTTSADWEGRVFEFSPDTGDLIPLGARFTGGHIPYALAWHMGRLWLGTNKADGSAGKVYFLRPDIDTAWTQDHDLTTDTLGGVCCLLSHADGKLYVGTDAGAGVFAQILVRSDAGVYTTSDTGFTGTARVNNAFLSLCTFGGNLYAGYFNNDTTKIAKIRKWNGAAWSTVYTGATTTLIPFQQLFVDDATAVMYVVGGGLLIQGVLLSTPDGTTYTDLSAQLFGPATCLPLHAMLVLQ